MEKETKDFEFVITETLEKHIVINADNKEEAFRMLHEQYDNKKIVLTADDFSGVEIQEISHEKEERIAKDIVANMLNGYDEFLSKDFLDIFVMKCNIDKEIFNISGTYLKPLVPFPSLKNKNTYEDIDFAVLGDKNENIIKFWDSDDNKEICIAWHDWVDTLLDSEVEVLDKEPEDDSYKYDFLEDDYPYIPSATHHDYSPSDPWNAPGMSLKDFI